ncbi:LCP family protein [Nocardioides gilvus]|uniref:LCP family protein n=1 Tax=Nocardioides gilvus TaxID=1735589 RepID=UPI000D744E44|nr:LCP family protein [Nocardioides gilvus]
MSHKRPGSGGPEEGTPEYQWLYGDGGQGREGPEATRIVPTSPAGAAHPARSTDPAARGRWDEPASEPWSDDPAPLPQRSQRRPKSPRRSRRRGFKVVRLLLLLWLVFLLAVPVIAWSKINKVEAFDGGRPVWQPGTTYLLVGSDSRADLTRKERRELGTGNATSKLTDTIMLMHVGSGPTVLMSIPRDSLVDIPGHGRSKINSAYGRGGPSLVVDTVEKNTGLKVDHYVEIGLGGMVKLVDAVGGIEICPKKAMKDKDANLDIEAGCQEADGKTALGYARSRKTYKQLGDVDRARAQREVVAAVGSEAISPWTVINPWRYWSLATAAAESFTISEGSGPLAIGRFALAMTPIGGKDSLNCGVPIRDLQVNWDEERSKKLFAHLRANDTASIPKSLCTQSGLEE